MTGKRSGAPPGSAATETAPRPTDKAPGVSVALVLGVSAGEIAPVPRWST